MTTTLLILLLWRGSVVVYGQVGYASSQLERLGMLTNIAIPDEDGTFYKALEYNGLPITVIVNDCEVTHIGLSLFTTRQRLLLDENTCNFLERLALIGEIPEFFDFEFPQYLINEKIKILVGDWDDLKLCALDSSYVFQSTLVDGRNYINCWYTQDATECRFAIAYPANYHLITGYSMVEAEDRLCEDICRSHLGDTTLVAPDSTTLQPIGNGPVYLLKGNIYYLPNLNSNRYYVQTSSGNFELLYSEDFPIETLANLLTGTEFDNRFFIDAKLVKYGYRVDELTIPLERWLAFCIQSGCAPYFGVISKKENDVVCELVMHNPSLGYCHIMKLSLDTEILKKREGSMQARLNVYIPLSNIKELFND